MKYKGIPYLILLLLLACKLHAQVTIGNDDPPHEGAVLELKSNNKGFLGPRVQLESISSPNPITNPAVGLLVFNIADSGTGDEQVKKERFYVWGGAEWVEFVYDEIIEGEITQILDDAGIPRSAVYHLNGTDIIDNSNPANPVRGVYNIMVGLNLGMKAKLLFKETYNQTGGNVSHVIAWENSFLIFKKGTYSITFAYQFIPSSNAYPNPSTPIGTCTASSYFMDFPLEGGSIQGDRARIHNVAYHATLKNSHHGGSISYVVKIEEDNQQWQIQLGAGQSGSNCNDSNNLAIPGFSLVNESTFILVTRIGD